MESFEDGSWYSYLGAFIYGIVAGLIRFYGSTDTSDIVMNVVKILSTIMIAVGLIMVYNNNSYDPKDALWQVMKTAFISNIIYFVLAYLLKYLIYAFVIVLIVGLIL